MGATLGMRDYTEAVKVVVIAETGEEFEVGGLKINTTIEIKEVEDCVVAKMAKLVEEAQNSKT
ncbi:hypothetical protein YC2023_119869 [Brassica napus]